MEIYLSFIIQTQIQSSCGIEPLCTIANHLAGYFLTFLSMLSVVRFCCLWISVRSLLLIHSMQEVER